MGVSGEAKRNNAMFGGCLLKHRAPILYLTSGLSNRSPWPASRPCVFCRPFSVVATSWFQSDFSRCLVFEGLTPRKATHFLHWSRGCFPILFNHRSFRKPFSPGFWRFSGKIRIPGFRMEMEGPPRGSFRRRSGTSSLWRCQGQGAQELARQIDLSGGN